MRSIILPQALRITVPPMANYAVPLLKGASRASLIGAGTHAACARLEQ